METPIAEELNGYTPQVLKPAITLAGVTALSHAFENKLLKLNLVITLLAETGGK